MARGRFFNLDPERQEAILAAAAGEFAECGYGGASINRIIVAAGLSKGSLYYYFDDKADLFTTVLERALGRLMEESGWFDLGAVAPSDFWDTVLRLTRRAMDVALRDEWWIRLGRAYHRFQAEAANEAAVRRLADFGRDWWRTLIVRGQELGVIRSDLPLGLLVETVLGADTGGDRWMMEHWDELDPAGIDGIVDARVDLLRDMLDKRNEGWTR